MSLMSSIIIKTTPAFDKTAKKLVDKSSLEELYNYLEINPTAGTIIRGSGGVRKIRWKTSFLNKGKSGSLRILYHYSNDILVILITIYAKAEQENISTEESNELKKLMPNLVRKYLEDL